MSKKLPFFKFDTDSWLTGKIQLLTAAEKGIFIDLIARIWHENGMLKNDGILHRLLRVEKATLSEALQAFFDLGIMTEKDGFLSIKFIDEQIQTYNDYTEKQREYGAKGGRPKKGTKPIKKEEIRKEKEEIRKESDINPLPLTTSKYPQSVDEIMEIAASPQCGISITRKQAEAYFLARDTTDWVDAARRKISPGKVYQDLKRWILREQEQNTPLQSNTKEYRNHRATNPGEEDYGKDITNGF